MTDLIVAPAFATAESYCSLPDAESIITDLHIKNDWSKSSNDIKKTLLKNATRDMDRIFRNDSRIRPWTTDQSLFWPWDREQISFYVYSGGIGSCVVDVLKTASIPDDFYKGGTLFVQMADNEPPELEKGEILGNVKTTGTITFKSDLSTALEKGDMISLSRPVPRALKESVVRQALYIMEGRFTPEKSRLPDWAYGIDEKAFYLAFSLIPKTNTGAVIRG